MIASKFRVASSCIELSNYKITNLSLTTPFPFISRLIRDYRPINQTTKRLPIQLTFNTVSFEQFQRFLSYQGANQRVNFGGWFSRLNLRLHETEDEEDFFRTKLKELEAKYSSLQIVFFVRLNFVFVALFYILTLVDIVNGELVS